MGLAVKALTICIVTALALATGAARTMPSPATGPCRAPAAGDRSHPACPSSGECHGVTAEPSTLAELTRMSSSVEQGQDGRSMTAGVPEPGTIGLLGLEGMMLIASRSRRRSARRRGKRTG